ncbi:MAG: hypothetical protein ABW003_28075 [Microvirga sp.]
MRDGDPNCRDQRIAPALGFRQDALGGQLLDSTRRHVERVRERADRHHRREVGGAINGG